SRAGASDEPALLGADRAFDRPLGERDLRKRSCLAGCGPLVVLPDRHRSRRPRHSRHGRNLSLRGRALCMLALLTDPDLAPCDAPGRYSWTGAVDQIRLSVAVSLVRFVVAYCAAVATGIDADRLAEMADKMRRRFHPEPGRAECRVSFSWLPGIPGVVPI